MVYFWGFNPTKSHTGDLDVTFFQSVLRAVCFHEIHTKFLDICAKGFDFTAQSHHVVTHCAASGFTFPLQTSPQPSNTHNASSTFHSSMMHPAQNAMRDLFPSPRNTSVVQHLSDLGFVTPSVISSARSRSSPQNVHHVLPQSTNSVNAYSNSAVNSNFHLAAAPFSTSRYPSADHMPRQQCCSVPPPRAFADSNVFSRPPPSLLQDLLALF